jgi:hypothetical protein
MVDAGMRLSQSPPALGSNFLLAGRDALPNRSAGARNALCLIGLVYPSTH